MNRTDMNNTIRPKGFYLLVFLLLAACSKEEPIVNPDNSPAIGFRTDGVGAITRVAVPIDEGATFGVLAYTCPTGTFDPINHTPNLLYNARVEKYVSEGVTTGYIYNPTVHWPATGKVQFAAYYPHSSSLAAGTITPSPFTSVGLPKFTVVMGLERGSVDFATSVVGPIGAVVSGSDPADTPARTDNYVNFTFKRHMSYISFRAKAINIPANTRMFIHQITLHNIYRKGTYNLTSASTDKWEDRGIDGTTGATLSIASIGVPVSSTDFKDIVNPNSTTGVTLSVIPQTYDNVEITVLYSIEYLKPDGGCEHSVVASKTIPMTVDWQEGKQHIYDIEFAFNEVYGENALFHFTVKPWTVVNVGTNM